MYFTSRVSKGKKLWLTWLVFVTGTVVFVFETLDLKIPQRSVRKISTDDNTQEIYNIQRGKATNKWIVIALENVNDVDVSYLDDVTDWQMAVVGHLPYIDSCRKPRCTYIHPGNQHGLNFRSLSHVGEKGYQLKNIGFLYAMLQSADVIYDLEYGVRPVNPDNFIYSDVTHGLVYTDNITFNYYNHFGQPHLYPRGFPTLENKTLSKIYDICLLKTPPVQQGLISGRSPVYNFQRSKLEKMSKQEPDIQFDAAAPPVFVPPGKFSVLTSGNTVFTRKAFWALFLPTGCRQEQNRECFARGHSVNTLFSNGFIRGYVAQRLLWETGDFVGVMGVTGSLNSSDPQSVVSSDQGIKDTAELLSKKFKTWTCDSHKSLHGCYEQLLNYIVYINVLHKENIPMLQSWLYDIKTLFQETERPGWDPAHKYQGGSCSRAYFAPNLKHNLIYNLTSMTIYKTLPWDNKPFCPDVEEVRLALKTNKSPKYLFPDVLLIVEINYSRLYSTINTAEKIYRRYFPNILYCGPSTTDFLLYNGGWKNANVSHIEGVKDGWYYLYDCISHAMKMNYRVKGYLHIGDDTLLHLWNLHSLPRDSVWFNKNLGLYNRSIVSHPWAWWRLPRGRSNMEKVLTEIKEISKSGQGSADLANKFFTNYVQNRNSMDFMYGSTCDFYYVPHKVKDMFVFLTSLLRKYNVIVELGIPTILQGLDHVDNIKLIPGKLLFGEQRRKIQELFRTDDYFMHPVKFGSLLKSDVGRAFYCERIQPLFEGSIELHHKQNVL